MTPRFRAIAAQRAERDGRTSASGLVLPGMNSTAPMPGPTPVPTENVWLDKLVRVYLIAREYLTPFDEARGRVFDRDQWISMLLAKYPAEEYLCQLAALNHASSSDELTMAYQDRFLEVISDDAAEPSRAPSPETATDSDAGSSHARLCSARSGWSWSQTHLQPRWTLRLPPTLKTSIPEALPCCWSTWPPTRCHRNAAQTSRGSVALESPWPWR